VLQPGKLPNGITFLLHNNKNNNHLFIITFSPGEVFLQAGVLTLILSLMGSSWLGFLWPHALAGANPYLGGDYQLAMHKRGNMYVYPGLMRGNAKSFHGWLCRDLNPCQWDKNPMH